MKLERHILLKILKRLQAGILAIGTLWTVNVTAGSDTPAAAALALRQALCLPALRWELGEHNQDLSAAAALTLRQSPLLYPFYDFSEKKQISNSTSDETGEIQEEVNDEQSENTEQAEETTPTEEIIDTVENFTPPQEAIENGAIPKTLVPNDPSAYTVCGRVYISTSTNYSLSTSELREPFEAELTGEAPQVLILHTHGSEAYTPAPGTEVVWSGENRSTDSRWNVVRVGDEIANVFEDAGISVIHDRTLYDYPDYTGSYDRSLAAINSYLAQYPSIRFILDVHRDAIQDSSGREYKVISNIEGVGTAAQLTLVVGSDAGGLSHPKWKENLKLAVAIQEQILSEYPTLMRPLLFRKSRYNQHATTGSLLVEVGAAGNAPEEAILAARLFAEQMVIVLEDRSK